MRPVERAIWKYAKPLRDLDDLLTFDMPRGARIRSVVNQRESLAVYAEVDTEAPRRLRMFRVAGTGHPLDLPAGAVFVGSVLFAGDELVFHVYDLGES